jgi:hypothetical protein
MVETDPASGSCRSRPPLGQHSGCVIVLQDARGSAAGARAPRFS